jgi:hypothetical protein
MNSSRMNSSRMTDFSLSTSTIRRFGEDVTITVVSLNGRAVGRLRPLSSGQIRWCCDGEHTPFAVGDVATRAEALDAIADALRAAHGPTMEPANVRA